MATPRARGNLALLTQVDTWLDNAIAAKGAVIRERAIAGPDDQALRERLLRLDATIDVLADIKRSVTWADR